MKRNLLTARDALNIAAQHGFSVRQSNWHRKMIRDAILDARKARWFPTYPGRRKSALHYFDECMTRMAAAIREDAKSYGVPARISIGAWR